MKMTGNTILVTGGGTGIGRGLAEAFHKLGNTVIIAGRRQGVLRETAAANPGMEFVALDTGDAKSIDGAVQHLAERFPKLNVVVHNAGIMKNENLQSTSTDVATQTVATNLLGPILLTSALMPTLLQQPSGAILTVTSGLAYIPLAMTPTYSATKAALHSYTQSLRYQLQDTGLEVIELAPPYVQTELMGERQKSDPMAMPLADYLNETLHLLQTEPDAKEILVERVKPMRFAERGNYDEMFKTRYDGFMKARAAEMPPKE